uniref:Ranatuerin-6 n=1 Tax=Aquarana catesbeiana TaxID=8400 RepID=TP6_AQUCT|nr:RecName: Full=Ranatuerin-6; AltName: Full=Temporin [Aquarana catesbeiana]
FISAIASMLGKFL